MTGARLSTVAEVAPDVHAVDAGFDGVPLTVYVVGDPAGELALVDAGVATTPERDLLPALRELGARPEQVRLLLNTHAHHDHAGGNAALRAAAPELQVAVHRADAAWVRSPERYLVELYGAASDPAFRDRIRRLMGAGTPVDRLLQNGDVLAAGGGKLEIASAPAHTPGHVIAHDVARGAAFVGDALQGRGFEIEGRPRLFPCYADVAVYRASVRAIAAGSERHLCTAHFGVLDRAGCAALAQESLAFADELDALLRAERARRGGELTVASGVQAALATWPQFGAGVQCHITVGAHLAELFRAHEQPMSQFIEVGFPDMLTALDSGRVDAVWELDPFLTQGRGEGDRMVLANFVEAAPRLPLTAYFTTRSYAGEHPDVVDAFRTAMQRSSQYATDHPDAVRQIVTTFTKIPPAAAQAMALPVFTTDVSSDALQSLAGSMERFGLVKHQPDLKALFVTG